MNSKTVWVEASRAGDLVAIRVRDRGLGIASDEQRQIFDKFFRASSAKTADAKGTGLGLAMVQHTVTAHGGKLLVESQLEAGSTFTILLPRNLPVCTDPHRSGSSREPRTCTIENSATLESKSARSRWAHG